MSDDKSYLDYTSDLEGMSLYLENQEKFFEAPRESDKVLLALIAKKLNEMGDAAKGARLIDCGCSTSSFLSHVKIAFPDLELHGIDIAPTVIEANKKSERLAGIQFAEVDMTTMAFDEPFDILICNRSMMFFDLASFDVVVKKIAGAIRPGGRWIMLDYMNPFEQELTIDDVSVWYPEGNRLHMRSYKTHRRSLKDAGFAEPTFTPFEILIDMPEHPDPSQIYTRTVMTTEGKRLQFRGAIYQPWCFLEADIPA
tara:strand:+ start:34447 stop:35208 length:762 start_codon:yes stop_codon:yes gene_type:complete